MVSGLECTRYYKGQVEIGVIARYKSRIDKLPAEL